VRTASTQLKAAIIAESTTLARLWQVERSDGSMLRFTDAVRPATIDVGDGDVVFRSDISFSSSAIFTSRTFANQQSVTLTFFLDDNGFKEDDIRARLYDKAKGTIYVYDYEHPEYGAILMYNGVFGTIKLSDQKIATVEIVPSTAAVNGLGIGLDKYSQTCRASLGDAKCKIDIQALKVAFTVDSASGGSFVASELTQPAAHWQLGFVKWLTGKNAGATSSVQSNDPGSTSAFLLSPPFFDIAVGDTGEIFPGCDKTRATCIAKFNNILNLRAEPDVPDGANAISSHVIGTVNNAR
jgi:uncharacterized phage protein (TIGR02218 family)